MKAISIILNVLLLIPLYKLIMVATQLYRNHDSLQGYAISNDQVYEFEKPYIILSIIYAFVGLVAIGLNYKRKYIINIVLCTLAIIYFIIVLSLNNI